MVLLVLGSIGERVPAIRGDQIVSVVYAVGDAREAGQAE